MEATTQTATDVRAALGRNIRIRRGQLRMSQALLAERTSDVIGSNVFDTQISRWETGPSLPSVITLAAIAEVLLCTVDDLLASPFTLEPPPGF